MKTESMEDLLVDLRDLGRVMSTEEVEEIGTQMAIDDHEYFFFTSEIETRSVS